MTDTNPPRRIAPQGGPHSWTADALSPADWMVPVGAEAAAAVMAAPGAGRPVLDPLLSRIAERLTHGRGFALLRGLPALQDAQAVLAALGDRLGHRVKMQEGEGDILTVPADILLMLCRESASVTLYSAAAVHNALLKTDRAALEVLYRPLPYGEDRDIPVFAVSRGVFSAWLDHAVLARAMPPAALRALEAAMATPGLALSLPLRPGDVLCLNPFLVWASRVRGVEMLALRVQDDSRLSEGAFAMLGE